MIRKHKSNVSTQNKELCVGCSAEEKRSVVYSEPQTESILPCYYTKVKCYSSIYSRHVTCQMWVVTNLPF